MRRGSDPELVVKNATLCFVLFFLAFLYKMCNTFCQEGVIRINLYHGCVVLHVK